MGAMMPRRLLYEQAIFLALTQKLYDWLQEESEKKEMTVQNLIREILKKEMNNL